MSLSDINVAPSTHFHDSAGLRLASCIALPALPVVAAGTVDLTLQEGEVALHLPAAEMNGVSWQMGGTVFLYRLPGLLRFALNGSAQVFFQREKALSDAEVAVVFSVAVMPLIHMRRGDLVLRASALLRDDKAVLLCGRSGVGKSTLLAALDGAGFAPLADDWVVLRVREDGALWLWSGNGCYSLWPDTMAALTLCQNEEARVRPSIPKYSVPAQTLAGAGTFPVVEIDVLREGMPPWEPGIRPIRPMERLLLLRELVYHPAMTSVFGLDQAYLHLASTAATRADWHYVTRPLHLQALPALVDEMTEHWKRTRGGA